MTPIGMTYHPDTSRQDTTWAKSAHLAQLMLDFEPGSREWVKRALRLRVATKAPDVRLINQIWLERHYLQRRPTGPRQKVLHYLGDLGWTGAAVAVTVALVPTNSLVARCLRAALDVHPCSILELVRSYRADDLTPEVAPYLMPFTLARIVKGGNGVKGLAAEWNARQLTGGLEARARVLLTYADPSLGHDGGLYKAAGGLFMGRTVNGKLGFAWALELELKEPMKAYAELKA